MGMERAKEDRIENIFNVLKTSASLLFLFRQVLYSVHMLSKVIEWRPF
jgi:hypothetical protein